MKQAYYGWKLLACLCLIMMLTTGFLAYGASVLNTRMISELQLDRKSLGLATSSFALCLGLIAPLAGVVIHKWGAKKSIIVGTFLMTLGALAMATVVNSLIGLMICYGLIMGCGAAMATSIPVKTVVSYWFKKRLALAITLTSIGTNVGGAVAAPLLAFVISASSDNWKMGWFVIALTCAISFLIALFFIKNQPEDIGQLIDGGNEADAETSEKASAPSSIKIYKTSVNWDFGEMIRHPAAWCMIAGVVCGTAAQSIVVVHGVAHFMDLGYASEVAAGSLGTMVGVGVVGRVLYGVIGDYIEPRFIWSVSLFLLALGMLLMIDAGSITVLYATVILLGLGASFPILCLSAMAVNYFGRTPFSRFMGIVMFFMSLGPAVVVVLAGTVYDRVGSYSPVFYTAIISFMLVGIAMVFVRPPKRAQTNQDTDSAGDNMVAR